MTDSTQQAEQNVMYVDAYKDFKDYKEKFKRYDWIIALLAKFGIKEKPND